MNVSEWLTWVDRLVRGLPVSYAFGAGILASVNPCGFLMLPSYAAFYLGLEMGEERRFAARLVRAVLLSAVATLGFLVLFSTTGAAISLGGRQLLRWFPWLAILVDIALITTGLWLTVSGRSFGLAAAGRVQVRFERGILALFLFGVAYGLASLGCTLPVFLIVVGGALVAGSFAASFLQFVQYALGMGTVLALVTVIVAVLKTAALRPLQAAVPFAERAAGVFLILAGAYLGYYWLASR